MSMLRRAGAVGLAALVALAIVACGQGVWGALAFANVTLSPAIPWASPVMAAVLAGLYWVLSGWAWPERGGGARRALLSRAPSTLARSACARRSPSGGFDPERPSPAFAATIGDQGLVGSPILCRP